MNLSYIIIISFLIVIAVLLLWLAWWTYNLEKPSPGNCDYLRKSQPDVKWSSDCSYIEEVAPDSSLSTPATPLYLTKFTYSPSLGEPWGANVWYRYRYVNGKTGGFGKFSPWTTSPIIVGSDKLPCRDGVGKCSGMNYSGKDSCQSNIAYLATDSLDYGPQSGIYINVHRYSALSTETTPPTDSSLDKIVGMMQPSGASEKSGLFIDVSDSPCKDVICTNVQGC